MDFETSWSSGNSTEVPEMSTAFMRKLLTDCGESVFVHLILFNSMNCFNSIHSETIKSQGQVTAAVS